MVTWLSSDIDQKQWPSLLAYKVETQIMWLDRQELVRYLLIPV